MEPTAVKALLDAGVTPEQVMAVIRAEAEAQKTAAGDSTSTESTANAAPEGADKAQTQAAAQNTTPPQNPPQNGPTPTANSPATEQTGNAAQNEVADLRQLVNTLLSRPPITINTGAGEQPKPEPMPGFLTREDRVALEKRLETELGDAIANKAVPAFHWLNPVDCPVTDAHYALLARPLDFSIDPVGVPTA